MNKVFRVTKDISADYKKLKSLEKKFTGLKIKTVDQLIKKFNT